VTDQEYFQLSALRRPITHPRHRMDRSPGDLRMTLSPSGQAYIDVQSRPMTLGLAQ